MSDFDDSRHGRVGPVLDSLASHAEKRRGTVVADLLAHAIDSEKIGSYQRQL